MKSDAQPELLRKMNVRRILEVLRERGPSSRADLMRWSGISAPTVSKVIASLVASGLVEEGELPRSSVGRPGRLLRLASRAARVIAIALDARTVRLAAVGFDGHIRDSDTQSLAMPDSYARLLETLFERARPYREDRDCQFLGVGISTPGLIDSHDARVLLSPNLGITDGHRIGADLGDMLGVPCVMIQEANAHCLAEHVFGGAAEFDDFVVMDVTTGLGVGSMVRGALMEGSRGFAGELGHIRVDRSANARTCGCRKVGCLETVATDSALCAEIEARGGGAVSIDVAIERVRRGDAIALAALDKTCDYLATAMSIMINLQNPQALFVHGRLFDAREDLFDAVSAQARALALGPPARACTLRRTRTDKIQGALAGILNHLTQEQGPRLS